jgi:hypothetical protein
MTKLIQYKNLYATREGHIYHIKNGKYVEAAYYEDKLGRLRISVRPIGHKGKANKSFVPWIILEAFVGPRPKGKECCHFDDNPKNNNISNLRWDTHRNNMTDRSKNHFVRALSKEIILEIQRATGSYNSIAEKYNISNKRVSRIKHLDFGNNEEVVFTPYSFPPKNK